MDDNYNQEQKAKESIPNEVSEAPITPNTQTETTNEPAKPQPAKKSKNGLIASLIIIIILLIGALVAVLIISNNNNGNNNGNNNAVVEDTEVSISEGVESKTMNDNLHIIFGGKRDKTGALDATIMGYDYAAAFFNDTAVVSKSEKLYTVVRYIRNYTDKFKEINKADYKDNEDLSKYYGHNNTREEFFNDTTFVSAEIVEDYYYKVFGEKPEHQDLTEICGGYFYNPNHKVYYNGPLNDCGGVSTEGFFFKNVGYSKKGNIYYADYKISYSLLAKDTDYYYAGNSSTYKIIKQKKNTYGAFDGTNILTDSDWEKVKTYRFTFVKNGDNFNYTGIIEK